jgi:VWFA-related protein
MVWLMKVALVFWFLGVPFLLESPAVTQDAAVKLESRLVTIDVTVMDNDGNYVTDLGKEDFTLLHDGVAQPMVFFEAEKDRTLTRPLAVVFALDVSGSLGNQIGEQQYAARKFVRLVQKDSVFAVLGFNDSVHVYRKFTSDPEKLEEGFAEASKIGGRTRLYDAIDRAITMLERDAPVFRNGRRLRRVVVVITDGFDYTSLIDRREVIRHANNAGVTVYSITLPSYILSPQGKQRVPTLLDAAGIVAQTGGMDFPAEDHDFARIFQAIAEEVRASYIVAYYPPKTDLRDGQSHQIKILIRRPGVTVRQSRYGYSAVADGRP